MQSPKLAFVTDLYRNDDVLANANDINGTWVPFRFLSLEDCLFRTDVCSDMKIG